MRAVETLTSGRYKVRFRYHGKQTSETFDRRRDADRFAQLLDLVGTQTALDQLAADEQRAEAPTLDTLAREHIDHLTGVEDGTRTNYRRLWARTWGPLLGHLPADSVSHDHVARAVNDLGKRYSRKSLENQRGLLASVLDRAVGMGLLPRNPAKGIRLPRTRETERVEMRLLTPDEYAGIAAQIPDHYRPFVDFLAGTGCRWGEAVALTVGDVALPNVRIRRALKWSPDNQRHVGPTKTKRSNRTIALGLTLQAELAPLIVGRPKGDLVFTAPRGGAILHRTFWSRVWRPAVAHLEDPRPRLHDLRHSQASWLLGAGVPIHVVQARLGHESIKTTVDTYGHLLPDAQLAAASAAELIFMDRPSLTT